MQLATCTCSIPTSPSNLKLTLKCLMGFPSMQRSVLIRIKVDCTCVHSLLTTGDRSTDMQLRGLAGGGLTQLIHWGCAIKTHASYMLFTESFAALLSSNYNWENTSKPLCAMSCTCKLLHWHQALLQGWSKWNSRLSVLFNCFSYCPGLAFNLFALSPTALVYGAVQFLL